MIAGADSPCHMSRKITNSDTTAGFNIEVRYEALDIA
jgi:hypothetical protein